MPQLLIFGDSICWGSWDPVGGGWVQRIRGDIDRFQTKNWEYWCPTYNLGVPGDTSKRLRDRIENEIVARLSPNDQTILLIAIGINDAASNRVGSSGSVDEYLLNLKSIISTAKKYTDSIGIIGFFPIDEDLLNPVPWDSSISFFSSRVVEFNKRCIELARDYQLPALDLWKQFGDRDARPLLLDGIHPNSEGHEWIYLAVREFLRDSKLLEPPFV